MEILTARRMGFCHGVSKAFEGAMAIAKETFGIEPEEASISDDNSPLLSFDETGENPVGVGVQTKVKSRQIYILGEIVHNRAVIERIERYGIKHITSITEIQDNDAIVIIRAHGGTREQMEELKRRGFKVVDLTCIVVTKVREKALKLEERHPAVIILGKKNHPEVIGLFSWLKNPYVVTELADLEQIPYYESVGVVSQTTFSRDQIDILVQAIKKRFTRAEVLDTVCPHTDRNQEASIEIANICDLMIVVGDTHSSNSKRLFEVVKKANPNTYFISSAEDIKPTWFPEKGSARAKRFKVGITAGASTPDWVIEEIARRAQSFG